MSVCIIIIMLVSDQKSIDRYNTRAKSIYRITTRNNEDSGPFNTFASTSLPIADKLTSEYSGVKKAVKIRGGFGNDWIEIGQNVNIPVAGFFADPGFIDFFEYELESGSSHDALLNPNSVVLKKETAIKLYGQKDPVGEIIHVGELGDYIVTGVLKKQRGKSHIKFDALASLSSLKKLEIDSLITPALDSWRNIYSGYIYVELEKGTTPEQVEANLATINAEIYSDMIDRNHKFILQPLLAITPGPLMGNEIGPTLPIIFVYFMAGLAFIIMISAAFNYMNLSIARALTRAREVGIRKVSGATRKQLIFQFLSEAILLSIIALAASHLILLMLKPAFDALNFSRLLHWDLNDNYIVHLITLGFAILVGILSGLIPAFVLSSFQPIEVLKGLSGIRLFSKIGMRKALIIAQFSLSLIFIISVTLVSNQLQMMMHADFGFRTEGIINVRLNEADYHQYKSTLLQQSSILAVAGASHIPAGGRIHHADLWKSPTDESSIETGTFDVDEEYIDMLGLKLLAGTNFQSLRNTSNEIIINENAVHAFGFESPLQALGEVIYDDDTTTELVVIGVVKDYHHAMMVMEISPMLLRYRTDNFRIAHIRLNPENMEAGIGVATSAFTKITDGNKIDYKFFDSELKEYYELLFGDIVRIVGLSSVLALTIACLGLLGIATYTVETKLKEVSIRKVLGATDKQLVMQLSKNFIYLILIAVVISVPIAYFLNNLWLEQIAYRVPISPSVIGGGVLILVVFGLGTIGSQTYRASNVSPVDNLRNE